MLSSPGTRQWLSPLVTVLFGAMVLTGILLWTHARVPGLKSLHEFGGLAFAAVGAAHLLSNWRTLTTYFRKPAAWVTLGAGVLVCAALLVAGLAAGGEHEDGREPGLRDRHERRLG